MRYSENRYNAGLQARSERGEVDIGTLGRILVIRGAEKLDGTSVGGLDETRRRRRTGAEYFRWHVVDACSAVEIRVIYEDDNAPMVRQISIFRYSRCSARREISEGCAPLGLARSASVWLGPPGIIIRRAIPKLILFRCEPGIGERIVGKFSRSSSRERPVVAPVRAKARDKQRDAMEPFRQFHRDARVEKVCAG